MKKLIVNEENPNGIIIEVEDIIPEPIPYEERVEARVRERYTIGQEFAIQRQRDTKPEEFAAYFSFVEQVKAEERGVV